MSRRLVGVLNNRARMGAFICAVALSFVSLAQAYTVNVDFGSSAADNIYSGQGALPAPGDVWNAYSGGIPANPLDDMLDSTGAVTNVGMSFAPGLGVSGAMWPPYLNPTLISGGIDTPHPLFTDAVRNGGADASSIGQRAFGIILSGLEALRPYNLAFYAAFNHSSQGLHLAQIEISDAASFPVPIGSTIPAGTKSTTGLGLNGFEENVNYVLFRRVLADADGNIYANVWNGPDHYRFALSGLQIQLVPEPSTLVMSGTGVLLLLIRRRHA